MERGGRALWNCADSFAASKTTQQQRAFYWASMAFFAFFGLLRAFRAAALHHTAKLHAYHIQQPTDWHLLAVQIGPRPMDATAYAAYSARGSSHVRRVHALPLMLAHLDKAQWGASPPPSRLAIANGTSLRRPPHPLQVHRGSSAPLLSMQAGTRQASEELA